MTHTTKTSTLPTDSKLTARERWNRMTKTEVEAFAVLVTPDEAGVFVRLHGASGEMVTLHGNVAAISARTSDPKELTECERADIVRLLEVERLVADLNTRAHVVLDRHGIAR
jgi:hypothetical protein